MSWRDYIGPALMLIGGAWIYAEATGALDDPLGDAVERYEFVSAHGSPADKCDAAIEAELAARDAGDEVAFNRWSMTATFDCYVASSPVIGS